MDKDRLSCLPDPLISHILSLMPTKYAVRTSVLSNAWKRRFLAVPAIVIDEPELFRRNDEKTADFTNHVNQRIMLSKTTPISEFRLKCETFLEHSMIDLWLIILLSANLVLLEIEQTGRLVGGPLLWPSRYIFSSNTLVILKLCGPGIVLNIPESVSFPKLKVFHLKSVAMDTESDRLTFSDEGYPLLEDLRFEETRVRSKEDIVVVVMISINTLQKLAIIGMRGCRIDIHTPVLQHLILKVVQNGLIGNVSLRSCKSIISADFFQVYECFSGWRLFVLLLFAVNTVKQLRIAIAVSESFSLLEDHSLPRFLNLTNLELTSTGETMTCTNSKIPSL